MAVVEVGSPLEGLTDGLVGPAASTGPGPSRYTRMRRPPAIPIAGTDRGPPARGICHWTAPDAHVDPVDRLLSHGHHEIAGHDGSRERTSPAGAGRVHATRYGGGGPSARTPA